MSKDDIQKAIEQACLEKSSVFEEIAALIAFQLGYGPLSELSPERRREIGQEAQDAVESWDEAKKEATSGLPVKGRLQQLLEEHHEISERILDLQDELSKGGF